MKVTTAQAAQELGCSPDTVRKLIRAGLLPSVEHRGVRAVLPVDVVQALAERPNAPLGRLVASGFAKSSRIAILRPGMAEPVDEPDRRWMGFSTRLPPGDLLQGLRGWWKCNPESVQASGILPVTLGAFVVAVLMGLQTWETATDDAGAIRHRFDAQLAGYISDLAAPVNKIRSSSTDADQAAALLLGSRLDSLSGGPIAYVEVSALSPDSPDHTQTRPPVSPTILRRSSASSENAGQPGTGLGAQV
jgi:excisionase family DNA binding protein